MAADTSAKKFDIFICHAKEDSAVALAMCSFLEEREFSCWIASRNIQPGKDYAASIINAIQSAKIMVVILSENANHSNHVRIEVERAFKNDADILPFRIQDVQPEQALEYYLSAYQWLDALSAGPETYFDVLARNCATLLGRELQAPSPKVKAEPVPPPAKEPEPPAVQQEKPVVNEQPAPKPAVAEDKPVIQQKPVVEQAPAIKPPPVVPPQPPPPPPQPIKQTLPPVFIKPPARSSSGSSLKTLLFTVGGLVLLVVLFFIYKATLQKHAVWFRNYTLTPVYIELDGNLTKINSGDSVEYWARNKYHLQTKASTYVLNSGGGVIGQNMEWDIDTTINSWHNISYPLEVGPGYFLLQVTNTSPQNLTYIKVSSAQSDYSYDSNVTIANDGHTYNLGYYQALPDLVITTKNTQQQVWEWTKMRDFSYPNQSDQLVKIQKY